MSTRPWAIALVIFSTILTASGQFFFKLGADMLPDNLFDFYAVISDWPLFVGLMLYGVAMLLLIISLRGGELSVIYPFISLGFVWVTAVSIFFLNEPATFSKLFGISLILFGVSSIGWGSQQ